MIDRAAFRTSTTIPAWSTWAPPRPPRPPPHHRGRPPPPDHRHHQPRTRLLPPHRRRHCRDRDGARQSRGLHTPDIDRVTFTSGTTAALNAVVQGRAAHGLGPGDEVLVSPTDHAATVGPRYDLARRLPIRLVGHRLNAPGDPDVADLAARATARTRVAVVIHVHNVYRESASVAHIRHLLGPDVVLVLDAAQSVGHLDVDVPALGPTWSRSPRTRCSARPGLGILLRGAPHPRRHDRVTAGGLSARAAGLARRLEHGTPSTTTIAGVGAAIDLLTAYGLERIYTELSATTRGLVDRLRALPTVDLLPGVAYGAACTSGYGIVSFRIRGTDAGGVGFLLDDAGLVVRTGNHCATTTTPTATRCRSAPTPTPPPTTSTAAAKRPPESGSDAPAPTHPDGSTVDDRSWCGYRHGCRPVVGVSQPPMPRVRCRVPRAGVGSTTNKVDMPGTAGRKTPADP